MAAAFWQLLPFVLLIKSSAFFASQLYRGMVRYTDLKDLWRLCQAVGFSSLGLVSGIAVIYGFVGCLAQPAPGGLSPFHILKDNHNDKKLLIGLGSKFAHF